MINPKYVLHPGPVTSQNDGDRHFIAADALCHLYKVPRSECIIAGEEITHCSENQRPYLIHLHPRADGNYVCPTQVEEIDLSKERLQALKRCTFPVGHPHKRFVRDLSADDELSERQKAYIKILAWRYRRQIPARLRPRVKPDDLPPQSKVKVVKPFTEVDND